MSLSTFRHAFVGSTVGLGPIDRLPVLMYLVTKPQEKEILVTATSVPICTTFYQDDVTMINFSIPGCFASDPSFMASVKSQVYLRFFNASTRQDETMAGSVTEVNFKRGGSGSYFAETSVMFSGVGSREKLDRVIRFLSENSIFDSVDIDTEQVKVKDHFGHVIGMATGLTVINSTPCAKVRYILNSDGAIEKYLRNITQEGLDYFSKKSESVESFQKLLDNFSMDEIVSGFRTFEIQSRSEEVLRKEEKRLQSVAASLSRRRMIRIRRPE